AKGRRLRPLPPATQADVLMHGADFLQGILGDPAGAAALLQQVLTVVPEHTEACNRLERHLTASKQDRRIVDLYALIVGAKADPPVLMIGSALAVIAGL